MEILSKYILHCLLVIGVLRIANSSYHYRRYQLWYWTYGSKTPHVDSTSSPLEETSQTFNERLMISTTAKPEANVTENGDYYRNMSDSTKSGRRISETMCLEYVKQRNNRIAKMRSQYAVHSRTTVTPPPPYPIHGGEPALLEKFPHMGAIGWRMKNDAWIFKCGCTLISPKFSLTAAHCSKAPPDKNLEKLIPDFVRLGISCRAHLTYALGLKDSKILKIIVHPLYSSPKKYYDIALIELDHSHQFTSEVQPACLWLGNTLGDAAKITGWGATEYAKSSTELLKATVDIIDSDICDKLLRPYCNRNWCGIKDHQLCAGKLTGGVDACQGDSGGPLQVKINLPYDDEEPMYYVIGVTSFGIGCANPYLPGVYTRVSSFLDWIESIVWPEDKINHH